MGDRDEYFGHDFPVMLAINVSRNQNAVTKTNLCKKIYQSCISTCACACILFPYYKKALAAS